VRQLRSDGVKLPFLLLQLRRCREPSLVLDCRRIDHPARISEDSEGGRPDVQAALRALPGRCCVLTLV
jgi:hypothetical protein